MKRNTFPLKEHLKSKSVIDNLYANGASATAFPLRAVFLEQPATQEPTAAILINVVFNYILIFGKFGAPALGVVGAAIATVLAQIISFLICLKYILKLSTSVSIFIVRLDCLSASIVIRHLCQCQHLKRFLCFLAQMQPAIRHRMLDYKNCGAFLRDHPSG